MLKREIPAGIAWPGTKPTVDIKILPKFGRMGDYDEL